MGIEIRMPMHTLNIDAARKHASDATLTTPVPLTSGALTAGAPLTPYSLNTPDILNSLISITSNPFFENSPSSESPTTVTNGYLPNGAGREDDRKVFATLEAAPGGGTGTVSAPSLPSPEETKTASVQYMRSQLIKDSLKLTIQSKRKSSGMCDLDLKSEDTNAKSRKREEVDFNSYSIESPNKLTPEDEERRKRRRERNKVAATKCRNKKKEKTGLLVLESETLEGSNVTLKSEISKLEIERRQLMEVLAAHEPVCNKHNNVSVPVPVVQTPYRDYNNRSGIINHGHHHHLPSSQNHYFVAGPTHHL